MSLQRPEHRQRFAPSRTGPLHLGHAFSALTAWDAARLAGGHFLLRIEDIDQSRARPAWEAQILDDLAWLGLAWPEPVLRQSSRGRVYADALRVLWARGLLYPCTCTRRDIAAALSAPQEGASTLAPATGPDGLLYPGTCRQKTDRSQALERPERVTLRLDTAAAVAWLTAHRDLGQSALLCFEDTGTRPGRQRIALSSLPDRIGDIVLARQGMGTSYHLAVVLDDAHQRVSHVTRGEDLFDATAIHVLLQALLDLPTPRYHHHRLIRDAGGKRLAKRDDARAIAVYRGDGATPSDIRRLVGL